MAKILLLYATTDGQTLRICQRLQQVAESQGNEVTLLPLQDWKSVDLAPFDKIVLGASIRYGKHSPLLHDFVQQRRAVLEHKPSAFFSVNVVARKPEKNQPNTNPYVLKFLKRTRWQPQQLAVFAGKIEYPKLGVLDRQMIRFIMWVTKGPTDPTGTFEFTDWARVDAFGKEISDMGG
ncbi:MAG: menaquinone-dependent protoporphyrinogen IX dehydrogenase [Rhodoferax sp.]|nr:menaquinone-dependent protoporphyrinogen IX dehydrogenase [Rhodoferax sp.]